MDVSRSVYVGVDVGSSRTKLVVMDAQKKLLGFDVRKSGTDFSVTSRRCLETGLEMAGVSSDDILYCVSTGYGRKNVSFSQETKTEIGCHAKGCYYYFPMAVSIIDIGGQDNKIIKIDDQGHRISFKMNRKCAAGTGAFLEEMSARLDIPLEEMDGLARQSTDMVKLGSFCTVFSGTEVLENIRSGKKVTDIVKGLFFSVIKRVMERLAQLTVKDEEREVAGLSGQEKEVLALVARGSTSKEIAGKLVISEHTARNHLSRILDKLGLTRRSEAAVFAAEHGLLDKNDEET